MISYFDLYIMHFIEIIICHVFHGYYMSCIPLYTYKTNIKWSSGHALLFSFIVFKFVILILRKAKYILGRIGLYFGGFGEKLNFFLGIWGAKAKYL